MKKIVRLIAIFTGIVMLLSCGDDFLDRKPADGLPGKDAVTNYKDAMTALNGVYDGLQSHYGGMMFCMGDVRGDDMQSATGNRSGGAYAMRYTLSDAPEYWSTPYSIIRRINNVVQAVDQGKITDGETVDVNDMYGQALTIRALMYFDLVRMYALPYTVNNGTSWGVPLVLEPVESSYTPGRDSVCAVYRRMISDLRTAIPKLKEVKKTGYINRWTAKALLSKIYLYQGDNKNALAVAEDIILHASEYSLWKNEDYVEAWSKGGNSELLFEVVNQNTDDFYGNGSLGYLFDEAGYADVIMTKSFVEMMQQDPKDVRLKLFAPSKTPDFIKKYGDVPVFLKKYPGRSDWTPTDVRINNIPVLRLSEVYLIAAEAAAKTPGKEDFAATYLNKIRLRANPDLNELTASEATPDRVLLERRKEMVGEGNRFYDLMRNNLKVVRYTSTADQGFHLPLDKDSQQFDVNYFRVLLPIPTHEVNANSILMKQQNPGY